MTKIAGNNSQISMTTPQRQKNVTPQITREVLSRLSPEQLKNIPKEYLEAAKGMETQFANYMINEMRKTVHKVNPESSAEQYYNSLLDYERAKKLVDTQGLGLKELILNQIYPQQAQVQNQQAQGHKMYHQTMDKQGDTL
ncbi:MAG: rod-binding protein [Halobacteriovoraceae bacterium]|nr:rod-binding protein [Halobacteriovoraceae bacterium]